MRRVKLGAFIAAGIVVTLALAFVVSPDASSKPDGLNKVAIDKGFDGNEEAHALEDLPTVGYAVEGVDDERLSTGFAGIIGVTATFGLAAGLFILVRRARRAAADAGST